MFPSKTFPHNPIGVFKRGTICWNADFHISQREQFRTFSKNNAMDSNGRLIWNAFREDWRTWDGYELIIIGMEDKTAAIRTCSDIGSVFYADPILTTLLGYSAIYYDAELTLLETLQKYGARYVGDETLNGHEVVVIETDVLHPSSHYSQAGQVDFAKRFYIVPDLQYSPAKIVSYPNSGKDMDLIDDIRYQDFGGIVLPVAGKRTTYKNLGPNHTIISSTDNIVQPRQIKFTSIEVNKSIAPDTFHPRIPTGFTVRDRVRDKVYVAR